MFIKLNQKQLSFIKNGINGINLKAYQIELFTSITKALNDPIDDRKLNEVIDNLSISEKEDLYNRLKPLFEKSINESPYEKYQTIQTQKNIDPVIHTPQPKKRQVVVTQPQPELEQQLVQEQFKQPIIQEESIDYIQPTIEQTVEQPIQQPLQEVNNDVYTDNSQVLNTQEEEPIPLTDLEHTESVNQIINDNVQNPQTEQQYQYDDDRPFSTVVRNSMSEKNKYI